MAFFKTGSLTTENYLEWIDMIQGHATDCGVWKFIDPNDTVVHLEPKKPVFSDYVEGATKFSDLSDDDKAMFREDNSQYRVDIQSFKQECRTIGELRVKIVESLHPNHRKLIFGHMTCREVLMQIKNRLEPSESIKQLQLVDDYAKARATPLSRNIESWLMEWERLHIVIKRLKAADFSDYKLSQDFLSAVNTILPMWVTSKRMEIVKLSDKQSLKFTDVLTEFRQFWSLTEFESKQDRMALTANFQGYTSSDQTQSRNEKSTSSEEPYVPNICRCGMEHKGQDCFYLAERKAPRNFIMDDKIVKKFKDACHRPQFRTFVRKANWTSQWLKDHVEEKWPVRKQGQDSGNSRGTFMTSVGPSTFTNPVSHSLHDEILLDSGATGHVCNNLGLASSRIIPPTSPTVVQSGAGTTPIIGYGNMTFLANKGNGQTYEMTLTDVAFAPEYLTTVVSWKMLKKKGVKWNSDKNFMTFQGQVICQLLDRYDHDVFTEKPIPQHIRQQSNIQSIPDDSYPKEINDLNSFVNSSLPRKSEGNMQLWHQRLGHPGPEALKHIKIDTVTINEDGPKTHECKNCALNKVKKVISRRPTERSKIPFERIHFDLISYSPIGFDGSRYLMHFTDDSTRMNYTYLLSNKSGDTLLRNFRNFVAYVKRQFSKDVKIIRSDQESGLGRSFMEWINESGIVMEWSAVATSEQNGQSERSGGVIQTKARCLGNGANLPSEYWPEFVMTAAYLINRTPTYNLDWLSPLSKLRKALGIQDRDEYSHLKAFGCTAYALDKSIPKGEKMRPRAKSGFLVGYNSRNIYRILLLEEEMVIGTRDVIFDETLFYDDKQELSLEDNSLPLIDFSTVSPVQNLVLEDPPIRNNEPSSQILDDEISLGNNKLIKNDRDQSQGLEKLDDLSGDQIGDSVSGELAMDIEREHLKPINSSDIDPRNIISAPRVRRKTEKAKSLNFGALVTELNTVFVGKSKNIPKLHQSKLPPPPANYRKLKDHPYYQSFLDAMEVEYNTLLEKNTFEQVKQTDSMHPIPLKWVYTYKIDESGYLIKFKARICVRGDLQPKNDEETYACTLALQVFRLLMALVALFDFETIQADAVNAFCNSPLDEDVYLYNPSGFNKNGFVLRLLRGLYGLRKSPKMWFKLLSGTLSDIGLYSIPGQPCIFTDYQGIIIFFFVDDLVVAFPADKRSKAHNYLKKLTQKYEFRILGELEWFVGVKITRDRSNKKLFLSQEAYIEKICREYNCDQPGRRVSTPLVSDNMQKYDGNATNDEIKLYQQKIGSLIYASSVTRPDISRAISHLAEFMTNPGPLHREAADHCLYYLSQTKNLCIQYCDSSLSSSNLLHCSVDAAFANTEDRRSIQGFVFKLCNGPIHWNSSKQATVTTSSTEAELLAISNATKELIWMQRLFNGIKFNPGQDLLLFNDNIQTIRLLTKEDPLIKTKLKHVDIYQHWVRERVQSKELQVSWISTNNMVADGMTKILGKQKHQNFIKLLGLTEIVTKIQDSECI